MKEIHNKDLAIAKRDLALEQKDKKLAEERAKSKGKDELIKKLESELNKMKNK